MVTETIEALRHITSHDLAMLGLNDVAYIKPRTDLGQNIFAIYTADGNEVAVVESHDLAVATIIQNDLELVRVH